MGRFFSGLARYFLVAVLMVIVFLPLYWMISSSFKSSIEIMSTAHFFPIQPTLENWYEMFSYSYAGQFGQFQTYMTNSFIVSTATALLSLLLSFFAGYSISRFRYSGMKWTTPLLLLTYAFPTTVLLIPEYHVMSALRLEDNLLGLILIYTTLSTPFCTWLLSAFLQTLPKELDEAAKVDGAGTLTMLTKIILPLTGPGLLTVVAYSFITAWAEYPFGQILITTDARKTMPLGLASFIVQQHVEWGLLLVGGFLSILPILILFLPLSRYLLKGLVLAGVEK